MRLIDADKIEFVLPRTLTEEEKNTYKLVIKKAFENAPTVNVIPNAPTVKAIPIEWLQKKLIEYVCSGEYSSDNLPIVYSLIADWRKENE